MVERDNKASVQALIDQLRAGEEVKVVIAADRDKGVLVRELDSLLSQLAEVVGGREQLSVVLNITKRQD